MQCETAKIKLEKNYVCHEDLCLVGGGLGDGQALSLQCLIWLFRFSTSWVNFLKKILC